MSYIGYTIKQIEDAIIATLKANTALALYVKVFENIPWNSTAEVEKRLSVYPSVLVGYAGGEDDTGLTAVVDHSGRFSVWCSDINLRSLSSITKGDGNAPGVYTLLHDVFSCLHFSGLGLSSPGIISCIGSRVSVLAALEGVAIFSREFIVKWRMSES